MTENRIPTELKLKRTEAELHKLQMFDGLNSNHLQRIDIVVIKYLNGLLLINTK